MKNSLYRTLIFTILASGIQARAQDTLTFMHYNLLNYGVSTSYCTPQNNEISAKEAAYREIFAFEAPDILTVNEINTYWAYHKRLADSTLLLLYPNMYAYKSGTNVSGDIHGNGLFYRKDKLILFSHQSLATSVRDFDVFTMYYKDPQLSIIGDTAFLTIITGHFKSGSTASDENDRLSMAQVLTSFLDTFDMRGPVLLAGDFNMKTSAEAAFQALINGPDPARRLQDPLNAGGLWYSNSTFAAIHTQSTQVNSLGCAAGGGLDDRFDIILSSPTLISGNGHYQIVNNSYKPLGNDGQHFNQDINAGTNTAVPMTVANALHEASDHLPVMVQLKVDQHGAALVELDDGIIVKLVRNDRGTLTIEYSSLTEGIAHLFDSHGRLVTSKSFETGQGTVVLDVSNCRSGLYFLVLSSPSRLPITQKVFVGGR